MAVNQLEELSKIIYLPVEKINKALEVNLRPVSLEALGSEDDSSRIEIFDETAKSICIFAQRIYVKLLPKFYPN